MLESVVQSLTTPLVLWSTALALLVVYWLTGRPRNLPPGPMGIPFVGYAPYLASKPHLKLKALAETYGDIMSLNMAGNTLIVLNSYEVVRKAYIEQGHQFLGRPQGDSFLQWIVDGLGILQCEGEVWKEHRRFALHTLKDFGFGKLSLEQRVQDVADDIVDVLLATKGKPYNFENDISISSTNVICSLMFDKHYKKDDPDFVGLRQRVKTLLSSQTGVGVFIEGPLMKILPKPLIPGFSVMAEVKQFMHELCDRLIKEHQENFDQENLRDYMDVFLNERKIAEAEGRLEQSTFTHDRLRAIALNLLMAGSETTATTLTWALKLLAIHPEVQKQVQIEIDQVVGQERRASTLDRPQMPYTEAVIMEVHRYASMLVLFPPRSNPEEVELLGFTIPKRSLIMVNGWSITRDERHYVNPDQFNPTRFLGPDGKLDRYETLIPFSIGKRSCPGEALARMELFLFLTALLQRFTFEIPEGVEPKLDISASVIRRPLPFELCAKPRY